MFIIKTGGKYPGGKYPRGEMTGGNCPGGKCLGGGGECPDTGLNMMARRTIFSQN